MKDSYTKTLFRLVSHEHELDGGDRVFRIGLLAYRADIDDWKAYRYPAEDLVAEGRRRADAVTDLMGRVAAIGSVANDLLTLVVAQSEVEEVPFCGRCGCSEYRACVFEELPCAWMPRQEGEGPLCTSCYIRAANVERLAEGQSSFRHVEVLRDLGLTDKQLEEVRRAGSLSTEATTRPAGFNQFCQDDQV